MIGYILIFKGQVYVEQNFYEIFHVSQVEVIWLIARYRLSPVQNAHISLKIVQNAQVCSNLWLINGCILFLDIFNISNLLW